MTDREKAEWIIEHGSCVGSGYSVDGFLCGNCPLPCKYSPGLSFESAKAWLNANPKQSTSTKETKK